MTAIFDRVCGDLAAAWSDLETAAEADLETAWTLASGFLTSLAAGELAIVAGEAEEAITAVATDPLLLADPAAEATAFLNGVALKSATLVAKLTPPVVTAALALAHLNLSNATATPTQGSS